MLFRLTYPLIFRNFFRGKQFIGFYLCGREFYTIIPKDCSYEIQSEKYQKVFLIYIK